MRVLCPSPCRQIPACPATPCTPSRRTGPRPTYNQYEGPRPARREHAPDAAGHALRADDGNLTTGRGPCRLSPLRLPPGRRLARTEPWSGRPAFDAVDVRPTVTAADGTVRDEAGASVRFGPWGEVAGMAGALSAGGALVVVRRPKRPRRDEPPCVRAELVEETDELTGAMT